MNGKSLFLAILIMLGLLASYTIGRDLRMASQEAFRPCPTARSTDAYDNFVKSCLFDDDEISNNEDLSTPDGHRKTVGGSAAVPVLRNSFAFNINNCLFNGWITSKVLSGPVQCNGGVQLCYAVNRMAPAQFAVCYDTSKKIPFFTGHLLKHAPLSGKAPSLDSIPPKKLWKTNSDIKGVLIPPQQAVSNDYNSGDQSKKYGKYGWASPDFICSRGHLTPKGDFMTFDERLLTHVLTNAAPQWQKFNKNNWAGVENAVRYYAANKKQDLYIFTGTGGEHPDFATPGTIFRLKGKVIAPRWYWKAVCDPQKQQSIVFVALNNINVVMDRSRVTTKCGAGVTITQTIENGVIECYSLDSAKAKYKDFQLPPFNPASCKTSQIGPELANALTLKTGGLT